MKTTTEIIKTVQPFNNDDMNLHGYIITFASGKTLFRSVKQMETDLANSDLPLKSVTQTLPGSECVFEGDFLKAGSKYKALKHHVEAKMASKVGDELEKKNDGYVVEGFLAIILPESMRVSLILNN